MQPLDGTVGDACDNATCESFFGTRERERERELLDRRRFHSHAEVRIARLRLSRRLLQPASTPLRARPPVTIEYETTSWRCCRSRSTTRWSEARSERYAAACLAGEAGLRIGEVKALRWREDVDMIARTLTVRQQTRNGETTKPKGRTRQ